MITVKRVKPTAPDYIIQIPAHMAEWLEQKMEVLYLSSHCTDGNAKLLGKALLRAKIKAGEYS